MVFSWLRWRNKHAGQKQPLNKNTVVSTTIIESIPDVKPDVITEVPSVIPTSPTIVSEQPSITPEDLPKPKPKSFVIGVGDDVSSKDH